MKKIYAYLLSIVCISSSCMHQQLQRQPLFPHNAYKDNQEDFIPVYVNDAIYQSHHQNYQCTAMQTNWEQLNKIAEMPYNNQLIIKDPTDIEPVYRTIQKTIVSPEQKLSLPTAAPPDSNLIWQLYDDAFYALYTENRKAKNVLAYNPGLNQCILNMQRAKNNGIYEDLMAQFAYEKWTLDNIQYCVAALFYCLKQYNQAIAQNPEPLRINHGNYQLKMSDSDDLYKTLGIKNNNQQSSKKSSTPAYDQLIKSLANLSQWSGGCIKILISYLHSQPKVVTGICDEISYPDLKELFYRKAYYLLCIKKICNEYIDTNDLYEILVVVNAIKKNHKKQEKDLGKDVLVMETTGNLLTKTFNFLTIDYDTHTKNLISIFCKLIRKYNKQRLTKKTPTDLQAVCIQLHSVIDFTLPDSFDKSLFDDNNYAFTAFARLFDNIVKIQKYSELKVQTIVDKIYQ